ncbi:hypothetical protein NDU88_004920 [Pleurodeles waltl]|uniref:Uncharacterized protein n=1 Tax=Pleurodeles waltl TaxID=8319 RepID=A0AAV7MXR0_PLEWA|nr:hypothetical protein NDU88_004920 [Pleurodeles waltl]
MELTDADSLFKADLRKLCKEMGLHMGKKAFKVDLQIAFRAYEEVKRLQAVTEEDDLEWGMGPNEEDNPYPKGNRELQEEHPCPQVGAEDSLSGTNELENRKEERKLKLELGQTKDGGEKYHASS